MALDFATVGRVCGIICSSVWQPMQTFEGHDPKWGLKGCKCSSKSRASAPPRASPHLGLLHSGCLRPYSARQQGPAWAARKKTQSRHAGRSGRWVQSPEKRKRRYGRLAEIRCLGTTATCDAVAFGFPKGWQTPSSPLVGLGGGFCGRHGLSSIVHQALIGTINHAAMWLSDNGGRRVHWAR